jgi:membrane protein DedA with SNARE-associated domain
MDLLAIAGLAGLILVKEAGVPLPVPGDLLIIGAGATLAGDAPAAITVLAVILVFGFIGASAQFFVFGTALRRPLLAALDRLGVGEARLQGLSDRLRRGGSASLAISRMTPGVRIAVIPAAAIARIPFTVFLPGMVIGNAVFVTAHFGVGFLFGAYAKDLIERFGWTAIVIVGILAVLALVGWFIIRRRRAAEAQTDAYECWADCSCPACVAILAAGRARGPASAT